MGVGAEEGGDGGADGELVVVPFGGVNAWSVALSL